MYVMNLFTIKFNVGRVLRKVYNFLQPNEHFLEIIRVEREQKKKRVETQT